METEVVMSADESALWDEVRRLRTQGAYSAAYREGVRLHRLLANRSEIWPDDYEETMAFLTVVPPVLHVREFESCSAK